MELPDVFFGSPNKKPMDWEAAHDADPDDEELPDTPHSVIGVLGFDPKEFSDE